jgi:hypothetical protein
MQESVTSLRVAPGRSCVACRRRKIKCDREHPCRYCSKLSLECVYLDVKPKEKEPITDDVGSRLERIEAMLKQLDSKLSHSSSKLPSRSTSIVPEHPESLHHMFPTATGKLVSREGDERYVTPSFWTNLDATARDERGHSEQMPPTSKPTLFANATFTLDGQSLIPNHSIRPNELHRLHPAKDQLFALWQVYLENVDPIFKLIHVPTTQRQLLRASQHLIQAPPAFQALMFAIYFAAITSIPRLASCPTPVHEDRDTQLRRYRLGLEQALAKANFMARPSITTIQALTLFLTCARMSITKEYVWSMVGLLIRLAMKLGLHRDPADLGLSPFSSEMRRRLWWQIYALDVRTAEESDMKPFLCDHIFNTRFPANVNDADIDIEMTCPVSGTEGRTEMLFTLLRIEISYAAQTIIFSSQHGTDDTVSGPSLTELKRLLDKLVTKLQQRYLQYCDLQIPICFLAETATRMIITKVRLTMHHPARNDSAACPEILRDLAVRSVEILEGAHILRTHEKYSRWVWLFEKYIDWDAVAFLLQIMISTSSCVPLERAWAAINVFYADWNGRAKDDERWRRLGVLHAKASAKKSTPASSSLDLAVDPLQLMPWNTTLENTMNSFDALETLPSIAHFDIQDLDFSTGHTKAGSAGMFDVMDWNLDDFSFKQGGPSWDMDFDESALRSPNQK